MKSATKNENDGDFNFVDDNSDDNDVGSVTISLTFYLALSAEKVGILKSSTKVDEKIEIDPKKSSNKKLNKKQSKNTAKSQSVTNNLALSQFKASCEYILAPFNKDPTVLELVPDCDITKIHVSRKDAKTINNWCEKSLIWTAWTNNHTVTAIEDNFEFFNDDIDILITTNPDKNASKFKTDVSPEIGEARPKIEKLFETIKTIYGKSGLEEINEQHQLQKVIACSMEAQENIKKLNDKLLSEVHQSSKSETHIVAQEDKKSRKKKKTKDSKAKPLKKEKIAPDDEKPIKQVEEKFETYVARINLAKFILGNKNQMLLREFLPQEWKSSPWIERAFVKVELKNGCLIPVEKLCQLNPMLISIKSANNLPAMPIDFFNLKIRCEPAYVTYCFLNEEQRRHKSHSIPQGGKLVWDDNYVIFLGKIEASLLKEYLFGPGILIEVHDRDLMKINNEASLFGCDEDDGLYNCTSYISYKNFMKKMNSWNADNVSHYHGRALCNLSDLLISQTSIVTSLNITNSPVPADLKKQKSIIANYISAGSHLNVEVTLHHPFVPRVVLDSKMRFYSSFKSPFTRVIIKFSHSNVCFLRSLIEMITKLNIHALGVGCLGFLNQQMLLSTYKLSEEKSNDPCFDVITGFHICEKSIHIIILEGIAYGNLTSSIYHLMQSFVDEQNETQASESNVSECKSVVEVSPVNCCDCFDVEQDDKVHFMHHTNMTFSKRLYSGLNLNLQTIQLQDSITNLSQQPLIYTRNLLPYPCYSCLMKLHQIQEASTITSITRNDAFPTFEELLELNKLFSKGVCHNHLEILQENIAGQNEDCKQCDGCEIEEFC